MHYLAHVFLDPTNPASVEDSVEDRVRETLAPFDENLECPPRKVYVTEKFKSEMRKQYGVVNDAALAEKLEDWNDHPGGVDARGLYFETTRNPHGHFDYFTLGSDSGARWDKSDAEATPHTFVTPGRVWKSRQWFVWDEADSEGHMETLPTDLWEAEYRKARADHPQWEIAVVDYHS